MAKWFDQECERLCERSKKRERGCPMDYEKVIEFKEARADTWRDMPESYWLSRLMEEVGELASALNGRHEHTPELELMQVATLCLNWLDMRESTSEQIKET